MSIEQIDILAFQIRDIQKACEHLKETHPVSDLRTRAISALETLERVKRRQLTTIIHDHAESVRPNRNRRAANDDQGHCKSAGFFQAQSNRSPKASGYESHPVHAFRPRRASSEGC